MNLNFEEILTIVVFFAAVLILVAAALLIWCSILALRVDEALRRLERGPLTKRDSNGRPLRERF